jgi:poly(A) polymerase
VKQYITDSIFTDIAEILFAEQTEGYVIGGYVRDALLNRESKDVDIVVQSDGIRIAQLFADKRSDTSEVVFFKNFGTAMVKCGTWQVEFVGARKESYVQHSRKPTVEPGTIHDDQLRRDFTINALAISLNRPDYGSLIDPFNGVDDLKSKRIRTPLNPDITFSDDPLRMMRAIRFASQLGFEIMPETSESIKHNCERIGIISSERISEELNKILLTRKPSTGFNLLFDTGLLALILPELAAMQGVQVVEGKAHKDNFYHTLMVLDQLCTESENLWLRWAALLHDIGKPVTKRFVKGEGWTFHGHEDKGGRMVKSIFRKLKLPLNEKMKYVEKIVSMHHRPKALAEEGITDSAIRRLIVDAGDDLDDLFTLCRADITTKNKDKLLTYRTNLQKVRELVDEVTERDHLRNWQPPIDGQHIMEAFGLKPSPVIGLIKNEIREAILEARIPNEFDAAYNLMLELGRQNGLELKKS